MTARADILSRLRRRINRPADALDTATREVSERIRARPIGPRPLIRGELLNAFVDRAESMASTVEVVDERDEVPAAVARYLAANELGRRAVIWPTLADFAWQDAGLEVEPRAVVDADAVGITGVFCAIAETGTLMMCSGPLTAAATSLLPATHIALVDATRIVASMEDGWKLARLERGSLPRAVNFISGPSRTGDIEQTIVLGAHGPGRVHVVIY